MKKIMFKGWLEDCEQNYNHFETKVGDVGYLTGEFDPMIGVYSAKMKNGEFLELYPEEFEFLETENE